MAWWRNGAKTRTGRGKGPEGAHGTAAEGVGSEGLAAILMPVAPTSEKWQAIDGF